MSKRKPNVAFNNAGKVMVIAKERFDIELTPAEAQKIVNRWVEEGIEITLNLAKKTPRNLIAFTNWIFPRLRWGLKRLDWSDTQYDDYKRASRWEDCRRESESRDPMLHFRNEKGEIDWKKFNEAVTPMSEILKKYKKPERS